MPSQPTPIICAPLFKSKPWGGRELARLYDKPLPADTPVGESWELVSLPENESVVSVGSLKGTPLSTLVAEWGDDLTGEAELAEGRYPLLIKFLDARQHLSVQVHPKPAPKDAAGWAPGIKHEAWYVLAADPGAEMFIGLKAGVTPDQVEQAANTPAFADLLDRWPVKPGDCFYLPSGTVHALGAGIVVAEVQTPSDVTYRIYDWDRVGLDGQPRELHINESLANALYDVPREQIAQPRQTVTGSFGSMQRTASCHRFTIDFASATGTDLPVSVDQMLIWIVVKGGGSLAGGAEPLELSAGDTVLLPAAAGSLRLSAAEGIELLEVRIPN